MKRLIVAALAVSLLIPATATAKFSAAQICGPSDCRTITIHDGQTLIHMEEPVIAGVEVSTTGTTTVGGQPAHGTPAPKGPWYRVRLCPGPCGANGTELLRVFPADGYAWMRERGWIQLANPALSAYRSAAQKIRPYEPASAPADPPSDDDGTPAWAWIAIGAAIGGVVLLSYRLARRARPRGGG